MSMEFGIRINPSGSGRSGHEPQGALERADMRAMARHVAACRAIAIKIGSLRISDVFAGTLLAKHKVPLPVSKGVSYACNRQRNYGIRNAGT